MTDLLRNLHLSTVHREAPVTPVAAAEGEESNVFTACYSTGASVRRWNWDYGDFNEVLSVKKEHIRTQRLDSGTMPILLDHERGVRNTFGVIEKHWLEGGNAYVQFRMETGTPEADAILNKLRQGIIGSVSVGYRIHALEERKEDGKIPVLTATDWEPFEVSLVSIPADAAATIVRSDDDVSAYPCQLITNRSESTGVEHMTIKTNIDGAVETAPVDQNRAAPAVAPSQADIEALVARRLDEDRKRGLAIRTLANGRVDASVAEDMVARGLSEAEAGLEVLRLMGERSAATQTSSQIQVGHSYDAPDVLVRAFEDSLAAKVTSAVRAEGKALEFMSRSMLDGYHEILVARGEKPIFDKLKLAERALHSTSDFAVMLSNAMHRTLQADYAAAAPTFRQIGRQISFSDFRDHEFMRGSEFPSLKPLGEGGEIQSGTIDDAKLETARVKTEGLKIAFTRNLLVNDSTGYLTQHFSKLGRRIAASENKAAYDLIKANPKMKYDNTAVFHANHKNLHGSVIASPDAAALSVIRAALAAHESDGVPLNFQLRYLLVSPDLQTDAEKLQSAIYAAQTGDVNVFAGKFSIIADQNLASHNAWYAGVDGTEALVYGYYGGEGPKVDTKEGWDILGMELRVVHDFGVGIVDDKGLYKVPRS
jgi:HK97 family phage prohead protease